MTTESRDSPGNPLRTSFSSGCSTLVVVNAQCGVEFCFSNASSVDEATKLLCDDRTRLRPEIDALVTAVISEAGTARLSDTRVVLPDGERTMRLSPLVSRSKTLIALILESANPNPSISRAATRFALTKRQTEVLALVAEGASAGEIARTLFISEYTAQGYIKTLLSKTSSRNRAAMVAKVFDWSRPDALVRAGPTNPTPLSRRPRSAGAGGEF